MRCCEYFKSYLIFRIILLIIISAIDCSSKIIINLEDVCEPFNEDEKSLRCINIHSDEHQNIDELNGNYFKNHGLTSLEFSVGRFDVLPCINSEGLKRLTFNWIKINQIDLSSFKLTPNLEYLRIENNELENLFENIFINLSHLQSLHIVRNRLTTLLKDSFNGLQNLRTLAIFFNDIKQLPSDAFEHLISVTVIDLSHNNIEFLPSNLFDKNHELIYLDLSHNKLSKSEFIYPENLKTLDLTWNNFEEIHLDRLPCILTTLRLGETSLMRITKANTALKYNLQEISIIISRIDNFEFLENLCNLNSLYFSAAESLNTSEIFQSINIRESCTGGPNIKYLTLNNNKLKHINYELMANFKKLEVLNLQDNYLTEIPCENLMIEHPQLSIMYLSGNLFNCSFKAKMTECFESKKTNVFLGGCIHCNTNVNHEFHSKSCPESFLYNASTPSIDIDYNVKSTTKNVESTTKKVESTTKNVESTTKNVESTTKNVGSTTKNVESTTKNVESTTEEIFHSETSSFKDVEFSTEEVSNNSKSAKFYPPENDTNVNTESKSVKNDTHISWIKIIGIK